MNFSNFYKKQFTNIYVIRELMCNPDVKQVLSVLDTIPVHIVTSKEEIPDSDMHQHTLFINLPKAPIAGRCPGSKGHLCCNYLTIDLYEGCTIGCTYCIMKSYLNFSPVTVNMNIDETISLILRWARENPDTTIRIGTGEVGDSLLYDPLFRLSEIFIKAFSPFPNIYFELKTKTNFVDHLLHIRKKGNTVIGFSLNPPKIAGEEEPFGATIGERFEAAVKAVRAGYNISFHFDPIIRFPGWEQEYVKVVQNLKLIPGEKLAWISLGTFRYTPKLKGRIDSRWFLFDEFVPCKDNKYRYIQRRRRGMYKIMKEAIENIHPDVPLYMCMESPAMWEYIFGEKPEKIDTLCTIFKRIKRCS
ncbi:MAG: radical SAM protein [Spirochaetales bacterium]|nr:radical SAM protein [Spirochaetales bacterium]